MGFRENLKSELAYADMKVKELAELSGVKKSTIDSYLRENSYTPSVEAAIRIAGALGVSVEYLVIGKEADKSKTLISQDTNLRLLLRLLEKLNNEDRRIIIKNALNLHDELTNRNRKVDV